jgi:hypothetical protein
LGRERLVWLRMLKNSARNWRRVLVVSWVDLRRERSQSEKPGPVRESRLTLPTKPAAGAEKALGLKNCAARAEVEPEV